MTRFNLNRKIIGGGGIIVIILLFGTSGLLALDTEFTLPANLVQPVGDFPKSGIMFLAIAGTVGVILYIRIYRSRRKTT